MDSQTNSSIRTSEGAQTQESIDQETRRLIDEYFGEESSIEDGEVNEAKQELPIHSRNTPKALRLQKSNDHRNHRRLGKLARAKTAIAVLRENKASISVNAVELLQRADELNLSLGEFKSLPLQKKRDLSALAADFIRRAEGVKSKKPKAKV